MLYYSVAAKLMSTKEVHHMEDLKSSRTGLSAASMWIQTDGGCKLEGRKHFNKSNVWAVHKEDKKGKTEAGRWRGDRSRAETDGEKTTRDRFPVRSVLSAPHRSPRTPPIPSFRLSIHLFPHLFPVCFSARPPHFLPQHPMGVAQVSGAASRHNHFYFCQWSQWAEDAQTSTRWSCKAKTVCQSWLFTRCAFILEMNVSYLSEKIFY